MITKDDLARAAREMDALLDSTEEGPLAFEKALRRLNIEAEGASYLGEQRAIRAYTLYKDHTIPNNLRVVTVAPEDKWFYTVLAAAEMDGIVLGATAKEAVDRLDVDGLKRGLDERGEEFDQAMNKPLYDSIKLIKGNECNFRIDRERQDDRTFSKEAYASLMDQINLFIGTRTLKDWEETGRAPKHIEVEIKVNLSGDDDDLPS